jgi:hypothetical protein
MALFLVFALPLAATLNIWIDEAYSLETTNDGLHNAFERALGFELQPPLYFLILTLWRKINDSLFFARLLSIVFTLAAVALSFAVGSRFLKQTPSWIPALIVAVNPITAYAALEIRLYSLVILLSALMLLLLYDGYLSEVDNGKARLCFTATSVVALYTHYFLGFILAGGALAVLLRRDWARLKCYMISMLIVGVAFLPMASTVLGQISSIQDVQATDQSLTVLAGVKMLYKRIVEYLLPKHWDEPRMLEVVRDWVFRSLIFLGLIFAHRKRRQIVNADSVSVFIIFLTAIAFLFILRNQLGKDLLRNYHTVVLFIPTVLSFLVVLEHFGKKIIAFLVVIIVLFSVVASCMRYRPLAKFGDWERAAIFVAENQQTEEPVFFFKNEGLLPFGYYYKGPNLLIGIPGPPSLVSYDPRDQVLRTPEEVLNAFGSVNGNYDRFWLITYGTKSYMGIDMGYGTLEAFLKEHCELVNERKFYASLVQRFRWRVPPEQL